MKIVYVFNGYSENTGYISNCLPKAVVKLGYEVHVIAPNVQVYFNSPNYKKTYETFLGPPIVKVEKKHIDGFTLHRLPYKTYKTEPYMKGLYTKLKELSPDVVHCFQVDSVITYHLAFYKIILGYKLFTANHILKSVFPLHSNWNKLGFGKKITWKIRHFIPGRLISLLTKKTFSQTIDAKEIAVKYFGVLEKKCLIDPLGVDTDIFKPLSNIDKINIIKKYNIFNVDDFVCIYTGRFSEGKNPLILAKAIDLLHKKGFNNIKGLFIGNGIQKEQIEKIKGCIVSKFVPFKELSSFYSIADIGVWPREDSTSMLDALACGLPIIVSNNMMAKERIDGCGLTYIDSDAEDLANKIIKLYKNKLDYKKMSKLGSEKIQQNYSWDKIAKNRIIDYKL